MAFDPGYYWIGAVDNDWAIAGNWCDEGGNGTIVPDAPDADVFFRDPTPAGPFAGLPLQLTGAPATVRSIDDDGTILFDLIHSGDFYCPLGITVLETLEIVGAGGVAPTACPLANIRGVGVVSGGTITECFLWDSATMVDAGAVAAGTITNAYFNDSTDYTGGVTVTNLHWLSDASPGVTDMLVPTLPISNLYAYTDCEYMYGAPPGGVNLNVYPMRRGVEIILIDDISGWASIVSLDKVYPHAPNHRAY